MPVIRPIGENVWNVYAWSSSRVSMMRFLYEKDIAMDELCVGNMDFLSNE